MQEICSYGSVGVPAGNRRHYPEAAAQHGCHYGRKPALNTYLNRDSFLASGR